MVDCMWKFVISLLNIMLKKNAAVCNLLSGAIICFRCEIGPFRNIIARKASMVAKVYMTANLLGRRTTYQ